MSGETEKMVSGWTVDTLHEHLLHKIHDLRSLLQERYETQVKAVDAAFLAQQTAMSTALTAAERAVATALLSAEKAVTKAEFAADKRFESMNEFRGQLNDQAATLMPRAEAEARFIGLTEKFDAEALRSAKSRSEVQSRLDLNQGSHTGLQTGWGNLVGLFAIAGSVVAILLALKP